MWNIWSRLTVTTYFAIASCHSQNSWTQGMTNTQEKHKHETDYLWTIWRCRKTEEGLQKQTQVVKNFRDVIHMEFELDKCKKVVIKKEKSVHSQNLTLDTTREIQEFKQGKNLQVSINWSKWQHTSSTDERKIEEEMYQEIKNGIELWVACQEWNYSNLSISCSSIEIEFW